MHRSTVGWRLRYVIGPRNGLSRTLLGAMWHIYNHWELCQPKTCTWPLFSNNHITNYQAQRPGKQTVLTDSQNSSLEKISTLWSLTCVGGWAGGKVRSQDGNKKNYQSSTLCPCRPPHTQAPSSLWEICFPLISFLSQWKTTLVGSSLFAMCVPYNLSVLIIIFETLQKYNLMSLLLVSVHCHGHVTRWNSR